MFLLFFCFHVAATPEIYPLSLHDALPILRRAEAKAAPRKTERRVDWHTYFMNIARRSVLRRSEEHTSELQSREKLVCRLPLEKKKGRWAHWTGCPISQHQRSTGHRLHVRY